VSRLETVSRYGFSCLGLGSCLEFPCLVSRHVSLFRDFVLTVSLSDIAKCCAETLAFLAERRPLCPFTRCLLSYCETVVLLVVVLWL